MQFTEKDSAFVEKAVMFLVDRAAEHNLTTAVLVYAAQTIIETAILQVRDCETMTPERKAQFVKQVIETLHRQADELEKEEQSELPPFGTVMN